MTTIREQLEESQKVCEAATEGPWTSGQAAHGNPADGPDHVAVRVGRNTIAELDLAYKAAQDAEFIAHARTELPKRNAQLATAYDATHEHRRFITKGFTRPNQCACLACNTIRAIEEAAP